MTADTILKLWVRASLLLLAIVAVWSFAPILIPLAAVALVLGGYAYGVHRLAERYRKPLPDEDA